jgi:RNA polymerase sigma factor (TIGR02999 family)
MEQPPAAQEQPSVDGNPPNAIQFADLYVELRRLAERQLRRNGNALVGPTTLLHEAYLGMCGKDAVIPDRQRFFGYAACVMRRLIIDLVRERRALKRGAGFHITHLATDVEQPSAEADELSRLSEALDELAKHDPCLAELVDLKYFCGYTTEEISVQRGESVRTIKRDWAKARAILFQSMVALP